ncbi:hypothetical protein K8R30_04975 [archaeon]|nr:hypothetical protein [archaeon]
MDTRMLALAVIAFIGLTFSIINLAKPNGWASRLTPVIILTVIALSGFFASSIVELWNQITLNPNIPSTCRFGIVPLFVIAFCFIGPTAITIAYRKQKAIYITTKVGLDSGLYIGLIIGLFSAIIIGTATGFLNGLSELTILNQQIFGPIVGLIFGYGIRAFAGHINELN